MPDQTPNAPVPTATATAATAPPVAQRGPTINIGDEFGTAQRNLPPVKILLLATAGVLIIAGIASFLQRAKDFYAKAYEANKEINNTKI